MITEAALAAVPPGTRVGAFLRRHREQEARRRLHDELRIEAMCREIERIVEQEAREAASTEWRAAA